MNWLKKYRITKLQEELHVIDAVIAAEDNLSRRTGVVYPTSVSRNAANRARIEFRLLRLMK